MDFFSELGFEEIPIEDDLTALSFEESSDGNYALITDEDGNLPQRFENPLLLACYSPEGSYLWSTGFKNADQFKAVWSQGQTYEEKIEAAQLHRQKMLAPQISSAALQGLKP